jgi:hypothetical protein
MSVNLNMEVYVIIFPSYWFWHTCAFWAKERNLCVENIHYHRLDTTWDQSSGIYNGYWYLTL